MTESTEMGRLAALRSVALSAALVLALGLAACAKDAESGEITPSASQTKAPAKATEATPVQTAAATAVQPSGQDDAVAADARVVGSDPSYVLKLDAPNSLAKGGSGVARVTLVPKKGWKLNLEFPTKLKVKAPDGTTVKKAEQKIGDAERFDEKGGTFAVQFTVDSAGAKAFTGMFKFATCTDATCDPKKAEIAWVVDVE